MSATKNAKRPNRENISHEREQIDTVNDDDREGRKKRMPAKRLQYAASNDVCDGTYTAEICHSTLRHHEEGNHLVVDCELKLLDAPNTEVILKKVYHLRSKAAVAFLQKEFAAMGAPVASTRDLRRTCEVNLTGKEVRVGVVNERGKPVPSVFIYREVFAPMSDADNEALWEHTSPE